MIQLSGAKHILFDAKLRAAIDRENALPLNALPLFPQVRSA